MENKTASFEKKKKKKHIRCTFFFYSYDERVLAKDNQRDTTANLWN